MSEEMQNTIRNFIIKEKEEKGSFPDIPEEEDGGSKFIFFPDEDGEKGKSADDGKGKKEKGKKEKGKKDKGKKVWSNSWPLYNVNSRTRKTIKRKRMIRRKVVTMQPTKVGKLVNHHLLENSKMPAKITPL